MYPDGTNNQDTRTSDAPPRESSGNGPAHRQVHAAHDRYFEDLMAAWNDMMEEFQTMQTDFSRAVERAMQDQNPMGLQSAQNDYQRSFQDASMSPNTRNRFLDAFRGYKEAVVKAMANADVDDLSYTDLMFISQSLATVAQNAFMLTMSTCDPNALAKNAERAK